MIIEGKSLSLEEMVYKQLEDEILSGKLAIGESLGEIALSKRLGVSRTPVRGALHRLAEDGIVEISPNKGAVVVGINQEDLVDIYNIRKRLEGLASACAAQRVSEEELVRLRHSVELAEFYISKRDTEHLKELDTEFHITIYKASGNRMLSKILSELHIKIKSYRKRSLLVPGRLEMSVLEHREILEAIEAKDAERADRLTSLHVERALENMLISFDKGL